MSLYHLLTWTVYRPKHRPGDGARHNTLEYGSEESGPSSAGSTTTTSDSQATVEGPLEYYDQSHPAMEERETAKDNIADSDIQASSQKEERPQKRTQKQRTSIRRAAKLLDPGEESAGAGRAGQKEAMDAEVARITAGYMERAGGDHMKAAGLWFEREERKRHEPWAELERGEAFIEAMKKDILDPVALRLQLEEEEEEAEEESRGKRRSKRIRQSRRGKERGGPSSSLQPRLPKAAREGSLLTAPKEPPSVTPGKPLAPLAALEEVELVSEPTNKTTLLPTQPRDQGLPSETPRKRKRSTAPDILESDRKYSSGVVFFLCWPLSDRDIKAAFRAKFLHPSI